MELVEQLGSGIPRVLQTYGRECFYFSDSYTRMVFPAAEKVSITDQVIALVQMLDREMNRQEMQDKLGLSYREYFRSNYLKPALDLGLIEMTVPDKPNSRNQKYRLSPLGLSYKKKKQRLNNNEKQNS